MPDASQRKYRPVYAEDDSELQFLAKCYRTTPGWLARVLFHYAVNHCDEAIKLWIQEGTARTEARRAAEQFIAATTVPRSDLLTKDKE